MTTDELTWGQFHIPDLLVERAGESDSSNTVRCCRLASLPEERENTFTSTHSHIRTPTDYDEADY